jgi:excisionase family DNA binding protein
MRAHSPHPLLSPPNGDHTAARLLTADDLCRRWAVPKSHVYRLAREGRLPTVQLGRYRRWTVDAIERFEQEGGTHAG